MVCTILALSMRTAVSAQLSTWTAHPTERLWTVRSGSWKRWNTEQVRMQRERPATRRHPAADSHTYFSKVAKEAGIPIGDKREYGIAMFFFPQTKEKYEKAMQTFEEVLKEENLEFLGWREVPVNPDVLGTKALNSMPHIMQHSSKSRRTVQRVWNLTGSCTLHGWYSKSGTARPMWCPAPAVPLYIKVCSW